MSPETIAIRKEMITLSLIKDELEQKNVDDALVLVNEKLKTLGNIHTNLKINNPEALSPTVS